MKWSILLIVLVYLAGCQSAPKKEDFSLSECWSAADCLYRTDKDKSICAMALEGCRDAYKERRIRDRLEYCASNKITGLSENECRLTLNQK